MISTRYISLLLRPDQTSITVAASQKGLRVVLVQQGKPVAYGSKTLTDSQSRYSNIEREMLAIVYGIQRYHKNSCANTFTVITDHKSQVTICMKSLHFAPTQLQCILLKIQGYHYKIICRLANDMTLADTLSRLPNPENKKAIKIDERVDSIGTEAEDDQSIAVINISMENRKYYATRHNGIHSWTSSKKSCSRDGQTPSKTYWPTSGHTDPSKMSLYLSLELYSKAEKFWSQNPWGLTFYTSSIKASNRHTDLLEKVFTESTSTRTLRRCVCYMHSARNIKMRTNMNHLSRMILHLDPGNSLHQTYLISSDGNTYLSSTDCQNIQSSIPCPHQ